MAIATPDRSEATAVARAALRLGETMPVSVALIRRGPLKDSFLVEGASGLSVLARYRDGALARRADAALAVAQESGLAPDRLGLCDGLQEPTGSWVGYRYVAGATLEARRDLQTIYSTLGEIIGAWHARIHFAGAPQALARFDHAAVPAYLRSRVHGLVLESSKPVTLHGDLNASNVVLGARPVLIDFDEVSIGPPEVDLAIALAYVNTDPDDLRISLEAIVGGYGKAGLRVAAETVVGWLKLMPIFMTVAEMERVCATEIDPISEFVLERQTSLIGEAFPDAVQWRE